MKKQRRHGKLQAQYLMAYRWFRRCAYYVSTTIYVRCAQIASTISISQNLSIGNQAVGGKCKDQTNAGTASTSPSLREMFGEEYQDKASIREMRITTSYMGSLPLDFFYIRLDEGVGEMARKSRRLKIRMSDSLITVTSPKEVESSDQ